MRPRLHLIEAVHSVRIGLHGSVLIQPHSYIGNGRVFPRIEYAVQIGIIINAALQPGRSGHADAAIHVFTNLLTVYYPASDDEAQHVSAAFSRICQLQPVAARQLERQSQDGNVVAPLPLKIDQTVHANAHSSAGG